jgi:hypothetical protein
MTEYEPILTLFFAGRLPRMSHARHIAVARILKRVEHGHALMHLGLQVTAIRAGVPEKYSAEITDRCWAECDGPLPSLAEFDDVLC